MISFLKQTFSEFSEDACTRMAAALAYFTVFALPPVFVILMTLLGIYYRATGQGDEAAKAQMQKQVEMIAGSAAKDEIVSIMQNAGAEGGTPWRWILSIGGALIGATGVVVTLQETLNEAWEVKPDPARGGIKNFLMKRVLSLGMILALGFILLVSTLLTTWIHEMFGEGEGVLATAATFVVVTVLFAGMFKYLPDAEVRWRDVLVGAVATALLFSIGKYLLSWYLSRSDFASQFGAAAASLAILLVWVYYNSIILLLGAEFTQVWAKRYGHGIRPEPGAVRVVEETRRADTAPA